MADEGCVIKISAGLYLENIVIKYHSHFNLAIKIIISKIILSLNEFLVNLIFLIFILKLLRKAGLRLEPKDKTGDIIILV